MEEFSEVLLDVQKEYKRSNKLKDIIIIILIVLMFLQSAFSLVVLFGMNRNSIM
jgi:succinate dehydrogenase hydrophobic anchor subunit